MFLDFYIIRHSQLSLSRYLAIRSRQLVHRCSTSRCAPSLLQLDIWFVIPACFYLASIQIEAVHPSVQSVHLRKQGCRLWLWHTQPHCRKHVKSTPQLLWEHCSWFTYHILFSPYLTLALLLQIAQEWGSLRGGAGPNPTHSLDGAPYLTHEIFWEPVQSRSRAGPWPGGWVRREKNKGPHCPERPPGVETLGEGWWFSEPWRDCNERYPRIILGQGVETRVGPVMFMCDLLFGY